MDIQDVSFWNPCLFSGANLPPCLYCIKGRSKKRYLGGIFHGALTHPHPHKFYLIWESFVWKNQFNKSDDENKLLLFYFIFQDIWNSSEGYYFLVDKLFILVESGSPPPVKNSIEKIILC